MLEDPIAETKALELTAAVGNHEQPFRMRRAFARFIREVSDAARTATAADTDSRERERLLAPFILPDPVDPLEEALEATCILSNPARRAGAIRSELAKHGLKIVKDTGQ